MLIRYLTIMSQTLKPYTHKSEDITQPKSCPATKKHSLSGHQSLRRDALRTSIRGVKIKQFRTLIIFLSDRQFQSNIDSSP